jgi:hypothetical protein
MIRALVAVLLATASTVAAAEPASARADQLFRHGRELLAAGKTAEACAAFEQSQQLEAAVTTLLNLAACREKNGQLATALALFADAEHQTRGARDAPTQQLHDVAKGHVGKLEPRVSKLTIRIAPGSPGGLVIERDGVTVDPSAWNRPVAVDGGSYAITARAPGRAAWSTHVTVTAEGDDRAVDIALPGEPASDLTSAPATATPRASVTARDSSTETVVITRHRSLALPVMLTVGALALGGAGVGFELEGEARYREAKAADVQGARTSLFHRADRDRYIAEGLGIGAIACAGLAVWAYVSHGRPDEVRTTVAATPDGLAILGRF